MANRRPTCAVILLLLLAGACMPRAGGAGTAASPLLVVERVSGSGWSARELVVSVDWAAADGPRLTLDLAELDLPTTFGAVHAIHAECAALVLGARHVSCTRMRLEGVHAGSGFSLQARFEYDVPARSATLTVAPFAVAGGEVDLRLAWRDGIPALALRAHGLALAALAWPATVSCDDGELETSLDWQGERGHLHARLAGATCADASGRHASEGLGGTLEAELDAATAWSGDFDLALDEGALYSEPVYLELARAPLRARGVLHYEPATGAWTSHDLRVVHDGVLRARVERLQGHGAELDALEAQLDGITLPAAYAAWASGFLVGTPLATLDIAGSASAHVSVAAGALQGLDADIERIDLEDRGARYALYGLAGEVHWARAGAAVSGTSLHFGGGYLYGAGFGAATLELGVAGEAVDLLEPLRLPLLGGALEVSRFSLRDYGSDDLALGLEATLSPIDLGQLTLALDWPPFAGELSGHLPLLTYQHGVVTLGGTLEAHAFDGDVRVDGLRITNPLGLVPEIAADIRLRNFDLEQVTQVVPFGRVSGRLDGDILGLRLLKGEPVAFDARLGTPPDDHSRHRLSQRAVDTIARVAGGGAALSTTFLRVFKHFAYDKLGIACRLEHDICHMDGIAPADDGYYIVKGALLPRVDLIGRVREVQWSRLMAQLKAALAEGEFRIE